MEISYGKLVNLLDYNELEIKPEYTLLQIGNINYSFYRWNNVIYCFSFKEFRNISLHEFFETHFPYTEMEYEVIKNREDFYSFEFEADIRTPIMIGNVLKLRNVLNIDKDDVTDSSIVSFIQDMEFMTINYKWFISPTKLFYFIRENLLVEFNATIFNYRGSESENALQLKEGTSKKNYIFLNPYTMFELYQREIPKDENIYLNYDQTLVSDKENPSENILYIRATSQELVRTLQIIFEENMVVRTNTIEIHFPGQSHSTFFNTYHSKIKKQIENQLNFFTLFSKESALPKEFKIKSKRMGKYIYPVLELQKNITIMTVIVEIFQDMIPINIQNINYRPIIEIDSPYDPDDDFEQMPDEFFNSEDYE